MASIVTGVMLGVTLPFVSPAISWGETYGVGIGNGMAPGDLGAHGCAHCHDTPPTRSPGRSQTPARWT